MEIPDNIGTPSILTTEDIKDSIEAMTELIENFNSNGKTNIVLTIPQKNYLLKVRGKYLHDLPLDTLEILNKTINNEHYLEKHKHILNHLRIKYPIK